MNSPYGSFDYSTNSSFYDLSWDSTPPSDGDWTFNNDDSPTWNGDFAPVSDFAAWTPSSSTALAMPQDYQYDFSQSHQVYSVTETQVNQPLRKPSASAASSYHIHHNPEMMCIPTIPHNGAITSTAPPPSGLGITADPRAPYPRNTAADQHHPVSPESLRTLFAEPTLPRIAPPCLYDDGGQPLQRQSPRFDGDIYTALWIRGEGVDRAGWCGFCPTWHKLKDSAYWYHLHYTHGIACHSGRPLDPPCQLRFSRSANGLEALCGTCEEWIVIGKGAKQRTAYWRHAYKCAPKQQAVRSPRRAAARLDL